MRYATIAVALRLQHPTTSLATLRTAAFCPHNNLLPKNFLPPASISSSRHYLQKGLRDDNDTAVAKSAAKPTTTAAAAAASEATQEETEYRDDGTSKPRRAPKGFWKSLDNQRDLFDRLARDDLKISHPEGWYSVQLQQIRKIPSTNGRNAAVVLDGYYDNSLIRALSTLYPNVQWDPMRFARVPHGYWKDPANRFAFWDGQLSRDLGIRQLDDWYNISVEEIHAKGGGGLIAKYYGGSVARAVQELYPHHPWKIRRFSRIPAGFFQDLANQRRYFDELAEELGFIKTPAAAAAAKCNPNSNNTVVYDLDQWYTVTGDTVMELGSSGLLKFYRGSLSQALQAIYPEHPWDVTKFPRMPFKYWRDPQNQRSLMDRLARDVLKLESLDGWYAVSTRDERLRDSPLRTLLNGVYNGSLQRALKAIYPEHPWQSWRFNRFTTGGSSNNNNTLWHGGDSAGNSNSNNNNNNSSSSSSSSNSSGGGGGVVNAKDGNEPVLVTEYLEALAKELKIVHLDDWYRVSYDQIREFGGFGFVMRNGGLPLLLKRAFPQHSWDLKRFNVTSKKSSQRRLRVAIQKLFPNIEIVEDYLHKEFLPSSSSLMNADAAASDVVVVVGEHDDGLPHALHRQMEIDIYLPSLSLGFEYHGKHHYEDVFIFGPGAWRYQQTDETKEAACRAAGITLIGVPYWWDGKLRSLAATIAAARPDLAPALAAAATATVEQSEPIHSNNNNNNNNLNPNNN